MVESTDIDLGRVVLRIATHAGPRILGYARPGRPALFADLPEATVSDPSVGTYRLLGGHRLWRAPEEPATTYQPDDDGVRIAHTDGTIELVGAPDSDGVTKHILVRQQGEVTIVDHRLENGGPAPVRTAPWAITQLTPGGTAILPQPIGDPDARLPNRQLVLWPYTDLGAPEISFAGHTLRIEASRRASRWKVGFANHRGWLAYHLDGELLVKWGPLHDDAQAYVDLGSSAECYRDQQFLELETVGPVTTIEPGRTVHHREAWLLLDTDATSLDDVLATLPTTPPEAPT